MSTLSATSASGQWLVGRYAPVSLFCLKVSSATSSVGTTLVVPTPYAIKMALVDTAFRVGWSEAECAALLEALVSISVRFSPPEALVTHTFCKIRQEPKTRTPEQPYISNVAYREFAYHGGDWLWAFGPGPEQSVRRRIASLLPYVRYVGKRGSFVQHLETISLEPLPSGFTIPLAAIGAAHLPDRCHVVPLDDFGPEASLEVLSSYSDAKPRRDRHRVFVPTVIPLARARVGPGFTEYRR
jgi:hypothetical protein